MESTFPIGDSFGMRDIKAVIFSQRYFEFLIHAIKVNEMKGLFRWLFLCLTLGLLSFSLINLGARTLSVLYFSQLIV